MRTETHCAYPAYSRSPAGHKYTTVRSFDAIDFRLPSTFIVLYFFAEYLCGSLFVVGFHESVNGVRHTLGETSCAARYEIRQQSKRLGRYKRELFSMIYSYFLQKSVDIRQYIRILYIER